MRKVQYSQAIRIRRTVNNMQGTLAALPPTVSLARAYTGRIFEDSTDSDGERGEREQGKGIERVSEGEGQRG
jgi:hypothetical protein